MLQEGDEDEDEDDGRPFHNTRLEDIASPHCTDFRAGSLGSGYDLLPIKSLQSYKLSKHAI